MKNNVKTIFERAAGAWDKYKEREQEALSFYRQELEKVRQRATAYKNEAEYISENAEQLVSTARQEIAAAEKEFCDTIHNEVVPALRAELAAHITAQPKADFMRTLSYYQQFGVPVDEQEVKLLAYDCEGNFLALRALASVAQKSGVSVKFPPIKEYSGIIDRLERMAQPPLMYCPFDYLTEGVGVLPDTPLRRSDGSMYGTSGRPTSTGLIISTQGMEATMKAVVEAGDTWSAAVVPEISEYEVIEGEDGEKISREAQRAADKLGAAQQVTAEDTTGQQIAAAVTTEQKEADARAARGRAHYFGSDAT